MLIILVLEKAWVHSAVQVDKPAVGIYLGTEDPFSSHGHVFENEPIDKTNPLLLNKKVLLSPHSATFTNECKSRMSLETTKNIIDFFENKIDKSMIVKL